MATKLFIGVPFLLILAQPDLGTASLVFISGLQIATIKVRAKKYYDCTFYYFDFVYISLEFYFV